MLIQRLVNDGAVVTIGDSAYQFVRDSQGRFVCSVENPGHINRLLSIDVYRNLSREDGQGQVAEPVSEKVLTAPEPEGDEQEQEPEQEANQEDTEQEPSEPVKEDPKDDREALEAEYKKLIGKKPHHRLSDERIRQLIEEAKAD